MRMFDVIAKKRDGETLSKEELQFVIDGYVSGQIPDYQMSALLMAIYLRGMTDQETAQLTDIMAHSGDMVDLSAIHGIKVDKHSTGGVGDKTTLVITPIVAACGVKIAKMSGRGLGHTGGTVDKMESVPGTRTSLDRQEFFDQVNRIGISVIGQSGNLAPADKKIYALRDVTATIGCVPLIASSIMSKKLAAGSDCILLDVKTGNGAFMKTLDGSIQLAQAMVAIGAHNGRKVAALITDMDTPLGYNIGNSLEVIESVEVLKGRGPADLTEVCYQLAANMLLLAGKGTLAECRKMVEEAVASGAAYEKLKQMFAAQGGDVSVLDDPDKFAKAKYSREIRADQSGWLYATNTEMIGNASVLLGAGRIKKEDTIDFAAGIVLHKKAGDRVEKGDLLATFYAEDEGKFASAEEMYRGALTFRDEKPVLPELVMARVTEEGVERF
ncbi:thymidine phosphorylase [Gemmiger sp. An120]|uniref:pyrimidine-nucleoside phosphorylase n=1 Tax=Gemmiger sp. An120 TaxID=1965549 RepID=UPI000B37BC2A|nr:pyrimidine-nucleoside phosphorylase [Gemmiger sp. An120]OUQ43986.1 thymidine phosphorylase [Gemmiger sp. An120]